jgi:hypothetical protein
LYSGGRRYVIQRVRFRRVDRTVLASVFAGRIQRELDTAIAGDLKRLESALEA